MSIQASFNQILQSAQIGAGLLAHTPYAKEKVEAREVAARKEKEYQAAEEEYKTAAKLYTEGLAQAMEKDDKAGGGTVNVDRFIEDIGKKASQKTKEIAFEQATKRPTPENIERYNQEVLSWEAQEEANEEFRQRQAERAAAKQVINKTETNRNQKQGITDRKEQLRVVDEFRAAGHLSNKAAKSLKYKINQEGGKEE